MIKNSVFAGFLVLALVVLPVSAADEDPVFGNVYGEEGQPDFVEGQAWLEQGAVLPAYPNTDSRELIEVDLLLRNFPFRLYIDPASVSIGEDRVVRYTAVLKSGTGATNVFYEGIRCSTGQYQRYAHGSADGFQLSRNLGWKYIGGDRSDPYLQVLHTRFMCPAPAPGKVAAIFRRLRRPNPDNFLYSDE